MKDKTKFFAFGLLFFWIISCFISCEKKPSGVLSEKEMVNLLVEMQLAEAYVNTAQGLASSQEKIDIGKRVLEKHGVSKEELDTTLAWYGRNMDNYSELFDKVDQEILRRKDKFIAPEELKVKESDDLWPYNTHLVVSPLSGYDGFSFSFDNLEVNKGDIIKLSFYLPNQTPIKTTLGVEYKEGNGEAIINNSTKNKVEISLQTDTSQNLSRIFGALHIKDTKVLPLFVDSISLILEPIDSLSYKSKKRVQKKFGNIIYPKIEIKQDSLNKEYVSSELNSNKDSDNNVSLKAKSTSVTTSRNNIQSNKANSKTGFEKFRNND